MTDCKMIINRIDVVGSNLNLQVAVSCPYDDNVSSPKLKIVFECDGKTRRLPFLVTNYFRQRQSKSCVIVCSYSFMLDDVFYNFTSDSDIKARFDFYYGDNEVIGVPFAVSTNVKNECPGLNISEENIKDEAIEGVTVFDEIEDEFTLLERRRAQFYFFDFDFENSKIVIKKNPNARRTHILAPLYALINLISFILKYAFAIVLLPYFIIDGFFAGLGILPRRATKPIDGTFRNIFVQIKINVSSFLKTSFKRANFVENIRKPFVFFCRLRYKSLSKRHKIHNNRVTFMSGRRDELGGNPKFVYDLISDREDIDFQFLLFSDPNGHNKVKNITKFLYLYATSKVVIVDDYFRLLNLVTKRDGVKLFQLWHACGAFKTFGFTRLGKKGGPKQNDPNHRMYDCAIVSSQEIAKHYAEGFGLSDECVAATGIPRTDIFLDEDYAAKIKADFYERRPHLKDKKIVLFAPTFRGNGQMSAFYPLEALNPNKLYEEIGSDYAILIKLHPFCKERYEIDERYKDYIIDLSEEDELNDLLFVTDILITDYSSVIFEASLLDIPMLFYAFDLYDYISSRDFYYDFEGFVPGKIVFSAKALEESIKNEAFEHEKVDGFKNKFFDHLDGCSSQRVADLIVDSLEL